MDTFFHIRMLMSIIMGLSITTLLKGAVKMVDHPGESKPYWVHLLWALYVFLLLVHFWWWEQRLHDTITHWVFPEYFFLILYVILYYVLCVLIFPDYESDYKTYFYSRKKWIFSVLALIFCADFIDTLLKGREYTQNLHWSYPVRNVIHILLCILAVKVNSKKFHATLVIIFIIYEIFFIGKLYYNP